MGKDETLGIIKNTHFQMNGSCEILYYNDCLIVGIPFGAALPRDNIVEQLPPISTWGTRFAVAPTPAIRLSEVYLFVTAARETQIIIQGDSINENVNNKMNRNK